MNRPRVCNRRIVDHCFYRLKESMTANSQRVGIQGWVSDKRSKRLEMWIVVSQDRCEVRQSRRNCQRRNSSLLSFIVSGCMCCNVHFACSLIPAVSKRSDFVRKAILFIPISDFETSSFSRDVDWANFCHYCPLWKNHCSQIQIWDSDLRFYHNNLMVEQDCSMARIVRSDAACRADSASFTH
jgi:hypothetical protein